MAGHDLDITSITEGYDERMRRLALFHPLEELGARRMKDQNGNRVDLKGFGLLTLLFFFEKRLLRSVKTGAGDLADFLLEATEDVYTMTPDEYLSCARDVISQFRPATGLKKELTYFSWATKADETLTFSYLKDHSFDPATNTQYYTLDQDGLELVFATREFYREFQLSIDQLILRKLLEKGEFTGALRQINEMRIEVESLHERNMQMSHELKRNIVSEETFTRYETYLIDAEQRLQAEQEEFNELEAFVQETKTRHYYQDLEVREHRSYELILKVEHELAVVHREHSLLLTESIRLKNTALKEAQESLYAIGLDLFNFRKEIVDRTVSAPLPPEAMKAFLAPFLKGGDPLQWSLLTTLDAQSFYEEEETPDKTFMAFGDDALSEEVKAFLRERYHRYFEHVLTRLMPGETLTLKAIVDEMKESVPELLDERLFYQFWMILHQRTPIEGKAADVDDGDDALDRTFVTTIQQMLRYGTLNVTEIEGDVLKVTERFAISNMTLTLKEDL